MKEVHRMINSINTFVGNAYLLCYKYNAGFYYSGPLIVLVRLTWDSRLATSLLSWQREQRDRGQDCKDVASRLSRVSLHQVASRSKIMSFTWNKYPKSKAEKFQYSCRCRCLGQSPCQHLLMLKLHCLSLRMDLGRIWTIWYCGGIIWIGRV